MFWFWLKRAHFREGQERTERALSAGASAPAGVRARALLSLGALTFFLGEFDRARTLLEDSVALAQSAGDAYVAAFALGLISLAELELGNVAEGVRAATEGQRAARASGDPLVLGPSLSCLAYAALHEGDLDGACRLHEEILEQSRRQGDKWSMGIVLFDLALLHVVRGRYDEARALCDEGIGLYQEFSDRRGVAWCLGILSAADAAEGRPRRAALLRGAMEGLLESVGAPVQASFDMWIGDRCLASMKASLGDDAFDAAMIEGRAMTLSRAIQFALQEQEPEAAPGRNLSI
jgi:non-specific serine/threonine protein kinase